MLKTFTRDEEQAEIELTRMGITPEAVRELLADSHRGWLCEVDGRVAGFSMGNKSTGEMWVIAVLKEFEDRGIGMALLQQVEDWLGGLENGGRPLHEKEDAVSHRQRAPAPGFSDASRDIDAPLSRP